VTFLEKVLRTQISYVKIIVTLVRTGHGGSAKPRVRKNKNQSAPGWARNSKTKTPVESFSGGIF
jgi:hypothetical protein